MDAIETTVNLTVDEADAAIRAALGEQGFGVLTEIDVAGVLKAKLDVDRAPLRILGACNPNFANRALQIDESVALLLPCNVVVAATEGGTRISAVDPRAMMPGDEFCDLTEDVAQRLRAAVDAVAAAAG